MTVRWPRRMPDWPRCANVPAITWSGPQRGECGSETFAFAGCVPGVGPAGSGGESHGRRQQGCWRGAEDRPRQCDRKRIEPGDRGDGPRRNRSDWSEPCFEQARGFKFRECVQPDCNDRAGLYVRRGRERPAAGGRQTGSRRNDSARQCQPCSIGPLRAPTARAPRLC